MSMQFLDLNNTSLHNSVSSKMILCRKKQCWSYLFDKKVHKVKNRWSLQNSSQGAWIKVKRTAGSSEEHKSTLSFNCILIPKFLMLRNQNRALSGSRKSNNQLKQISRPLPPTSAFKHWKPHESSSAIALSMIVQDSTVQWSREALDDKMERYKH